MGDSIDSRLVIWAQWAKGHGRGGGYTNILARHIANGGIRCATPDNWSKFPEDIELTERAIAQLRIRSKYLKTLIFQHYLYGLQPEEIATNLDRPKQDILNGLDRARDWIGDWIESQVSNNLQALVISKG